MKRHLPFLPKPPPFAVGLVHWPVYDRSRKWVCTNITNFDVHDIARACRTFGIDSYYLINPMLDQQMFVERMLEHWRIGYGSRYNPMRKTALVGVKTAGSIDQALKNWGHQGAVLIGTSAKAPDNVPTVSFVKMREQIQSEPEKGYFLLFGTGFGMSKEVLERCDMVLEPIQGAPPLDYRHLSVRSAASICLDRLLGSW